MKVRPVILCGGVGSRLWSNQKKYEPKQFIDFGGWTLIQKVLQRVKNKIYDYPIISTNIEYLKQIKFHLKKNKISKFRIILEPSKKNTAPAILLATIIKEIPNNQPLVFFASDHLIENPNKLNKSLINNVKYLDKNNIFLFGIKPTYPSSEYGYFFTKKNKKGTNKVIKFIEKPKLNRAEQLIKKKGYWNSGMFFLRKDSVVNNFKKYQPKIFFNCTNALKKGKLLNSTYYLNKRSFNKIVEKSFDYAILEKAQNINAINLNLPWSDLGSWKEISKIFKKNKSKYFKKKNVYYRPWGRYVNLFKGKNFLIKELTVNSKSSISLQKHKHRAEHWLITQGKPMITINKSKFFKKKNESVFIPIGSIHRIENFFKQPIKIIEAQTGPILAESDIVRYQDVYGRVK